MPRFLCDAMLGSLARWLRFFGFDAAYMDPSTDDRRLAERASTEDRWLLTRDRELASIGPRTMLLRSGAVEVGPLLSHRFPLDEFPHALVIQRTRSEPAIKIAIEP